VSSTAGGRDERAFCRPWSFRLSVAGALKFQRGSPMARRHRGETPVSQLLDACERSHALDRETSLEPRRNKISLKES
jgi:hypothetical protein